VRVSRISSAPCAFGVWGVGFGVWGLGLKWLVVRVHGFTSRGLQLFMSEVPLQIKNLQVATLIRANEPSQLTTAVSGVTLSGFPLSCTWAQMSKERASGRIPETAIDSSHLLYQGYTIGVFGPTLPLSLSLSLPLTQPHLGVHDQVVGVSM